MTFEEWFHKEYEPSDLQIKQYAERKEGLHIPAELYLEDIQKAYEAGQKDSEALIEKLEKLVPKTCENCVGYSCHAICVDCDFKDKWEIQE